MLMEGAVAQANKMVAEERMKVADLEEELRERSSEREALKLAMKILEEENQRFRAILASSSQAVRHAKAATPARRHTPSPSLSHSRHSSTSSLTIPDANRHTADSPYVSPQCLTPTESSPWAGDTKRAGKTPAAGDFTQDKSEKVARLLPPPLEVESWADSPDVTPTHIPAPPETAEPDGGASAIQSLT